MFSLAKGNEEEEVQAKAQQDGGGEQVSAADYDPSLDRREDEHKRVWGTKEEPQDVEMIEEEEEEVKEKIIEKEALLASITFVARQARKKGSRWTTRVELTTIADENGALEISAVEVGASGKGEKASVTVAAA